jgi:nucleoside-diphosphate kinase
MKFVYPSEEMATKHYYDVGGDEWLEEVGRKARAAYEKKGLQSPYETNRENGEAVLKSNAQYLSSGPVVAVVLEGSQAVELTRKIAGATEPLTADVGTIRADFTLDSYSLADTDGRSVRNLLHASGNAEEAEQEIKIWFRDEELVDYTHINEKILYEKSLFS